MLPLPDALPLVHTLEECACNAMPARQTVLYRGWVFRLSGGFTRRANAVMALGAPQACAPLDEVHAEAQTLYARNGLQAVFLITPLTPADADAQLADAGYLRHDPSLVLHRPLQPTTAVEPVAGVTLTASPSNAWLDGFARTNAVAPHHRALHQTLLQSITHPAVFATLQEAGQALAYGFAVLERGQIGLYDIAVAPTQRSLGYGRTLVQALLQWGALAGAHSAYLQVRTQNAAAVHLYESLGFEPAYALHYRVPG
jgi:ribosomal protein S18 acetylase RimI-like enzyme